MRESALILSNRKTSRLRVTPEAALEVRAPLKASRAEIDRFVTSKERWIQDSLRTALERLKKKAEFRLTYGKSLTLRGEEYPIVPADGDEVYWSGGQFRFPRGLTPERIKRGAERLYQRLAKDYLTARTMELAEKTGAAPSKIKIGSAKTRWGSCSARGSINYSWRLIMADGPAIDYVIVHELAHLTEMNHSRRFWAIVAAVLPDYRERQHSLRLPRKRLEEEGWD
ncbi:MAG: M48 family metallopeptidase [Syntrophomonadaceae bacterium]|jgi:predicted metal-dependent hydrolase|nr:M48 family metallopeptidase [Syntrophomonadaceae bacterium]